MRLPCLTPVVAAAWLLACATAAHGEELEIKPFALANEVVCRVNTEAVSKGHVEERMEEIVAKLREWKRQVEAAGQWNDELEKEYDKMYVPAFRDALRRVVRERLMLQYARNDPQIKMDDRLFEKRMKDTLERLKSQGLLGPKGFTVAEVEKRVRENILLDIFKWGQFGTVLDQPTKPEIRRYYQDNITRFHRPAGVKVRIIRIDTILTNKLTGQKTVRKNARELADRLREDAVSFSGSFAEMAKQHSDDEETKARGGLIQTDPKDPFLDPESYNPLLANVLRPMKVGECSPVFEFGKSGYAFVWLEARREAGPAPLEGDLHEEISRTLWEQKRRKQEDQWFRKALGKALVEHVVDQVSKPIPMGFFFEDEEPKKDETTPPQPGKAGAEGAPKGR